MATITLSTAAYNDAKKYAQRQNLSVDEFIVTLINTFARSKDHKSQYVMKQIEELDPELQAMIGFGRGKASDKDDLNGDMARMEYLAKKYSL